MTGSERAAQAFLDKPFSEESLLAAAASLLGCRP
jgi:hypothetical protein